MRRSHIIRKNRRTKRHTTFIFFDTEARRVIDEDGKEEQYFLFGICCYVRIDKNREIVSEEWSIALERSDIARFIDSKAKGRITLHVVAMNIEYDIQTADLLREMMALGWEIKSLYSDNATVIIRMRKGKAFCVLEDGLNRLRGSIKEWGKIIGLPKLEVDFDSVSFNEFVEYCRRDVEILKQATLYYLRFVSDHDLGTDAYTIAGQAMNAYRHRFMHERIYIHDDPEALELERKAYRGGMVRALKVGYQDDGPYYKLDVNSMYPYVMREFKYPTKLMAVIDNPTVEHLKEALKVCAVIAEVTVSPSKDYFPTRYKNRVIYPAFEYKDVYCTPELIELLEQGAIVKVHRMALYHDEYIFKDYVDYFYSMRQQAKAEGNKPMDAMCKLFLNSLYGKFGARLTELKRVPELDYLDPNTEAIRLRPGEPLRRVFFFAGEAYLEEKGEEAYNAFPAIAAHVTAYARMRLSSIIEQAGRVHALYCDTDSVIVDKIGYERLQKEIDPSRLGMLKLEGVTDSVTVYGRKDYMFGDEVKRKGVSHKYLEQDPYSTIKETWTGLRQYLRSDKGGVVTITRKSLNLRREIYDGQVAEDGQVIPFDDWPERFQRYAELPEYLKGPCPMAQAA
jgi:hypothetical protein